MSKVKSWEHACELFQLNPADLPIVDHLVERHRKHMIAEYKIILMIEAQNKFFNNNFVPDYTDTNTWKHFPSAIIKATKEKPSGVGFELSYYGDTITHARLGVRLCLPNPEQCWEFVDDHQELFLDLWLMP